MSYDLFKSILAPRSQQTLLFKLLKIVLSLFFLIQLVIIVLIFMISIFKFQLNLFDIVITFGIFLISFIGIGLEYLPILVISTSYFIVYFFDLCLIHSCALITYQILFVNSFGLFLFTYLIIKELLCTSPDA